MLTGNSPKTLLAAHQITIADSKSKRVTVTRHIAYTGSYFLMQHQ